MFGRGRLLYALVGEGINADNISEACQFMAGPCSCVVKDYNPGTDLLMTVDWEASLDNSFVSEEEIARFFGAPDVEAKTMSSSVSFTGKTNAGANQSNPMFGSLIIAIAIIAGANIIPRRFPAAEEVSKKNITSLPNLLIPIVDFLPKIE